MERQWGRPKVEPIPFGAKRAREIWEKRLFWEEIWKHLTPGEDAYIWKIWDFLPGTACWMDAFFKILNGPEET